MSDQEKLLEVQVEALKQILKLYKTAIDYSLTEMSFDAQKAVLAILGGVYEPRSDIKDIE
jgi:hypothetical protein